MLKQRPTTIALLTVAAVAAVLSAAPPVTVVSPDGKVTLTISPGPEGQLVWSASMDRRPVIEPSPLGILIDGVDLGAGAAIQKVERYRVNQKYPWRGTHATAIDRSTGARVALTHEKQGPFSVDLRVSDDAVAFRFVVPGAGRRIPDAASGFRIPAGSTVWSHGLRGHYEALYDRRRIEDVPDGDWAGPPVTFKLPGNGGYAVILEADLHNYAGMALQADGQRGYRERLGHSHPPSTPFTLRFKDPEPARLAVAAPIDGTITTPWRVVLVGRNLDALVNSDAVHNLSAPPDPKVFPQGLATPWLKPGRAVWRYLDGGENTIDGIKEFSRLAGELGFEYQVVEGHWQKWSEAELRDVVEYSKARGVRIIVWRHRNTLGDADTRRELFAFLRKAGVAGLKVDFLDHEAKEVIDLYQAILRDAAEQQLVVNFHGSNKPAGEARTWPNEMTREGIYGLEHRNVKAWAEFNTTFPFVRMLAGHADYTPVVFGELRRKETSWAHQVASAVILTSPLLVYGGHPASFLSSPASEILKSIPAVWDETKVLPPSEIGEVAIFARRSGDRWFVAAMNGAAGRTVKLDLSFLRPAGTYRALIARDKPDDAGAIEVERREIRTAQPLEIPMRPAGGFVVRLTR